MRAKETETSRGGSIPENQRGKYGPNGERCALAYKGGLGQCHSGVQRLVRV